ncbi:hypothetical protein DFJ74DRAFT_532194 [Hyaloraphidium curvatum]|nr:hypothetical protein DFJ74DRAFT_532194 [Hyaloraphidium curvatum]
MSASRFLRLRNLAAPHRLRAASLRSTQVATRGLALRGATCTDFGARRLASSDSRTEPTTAQTEVTQEAEDFVSSRLIPRSLLGSLVDFTEPDFSFLKGDLVLVHGFAGAQLADTHAKILAWPPQDIVSTLSRVAINWPGVSVPLSEATETDLTEDGEGDAESDLMSIKLRDALRAVEAGTAQLAPSQRFRLHEFDYDFRLDNLYNARRFAKFLRQIAERSGGSQINIVAHSMGGQIALSALSPVVSPQTPLVNSILFCGSPFQEVPTILYMFLHPHPFLPLSPLDSLSWRSGYGFLPAKPAPSKALLTGPFGSRSDLDLNYQDPDVWIGTNLANPLIRGFDGDVDKARDFLARALDAAAKFRSTLQAIEREQDSSPAAVPRMATLFSRSYRTPTRVLVRSEGTSHDPKVTHVIRPAFFAPGDGIVPLNALRLSRGWDYKLIPSYGHHAGIMGDVGGVARGLRYCVLGE